MSSAGGGPAGVVDGSLNSHDLVPCRDVRSGVEGGLESGKLYWGAIAMASPELDLGKHRNALRHRVES